MKLPPRYCRAGSEKQLAWTGRKTALGSTQAGTQMDRVPGMRMRLARAMRNQRKYRSGRSWTILVSVRAKATLVQLVATAANHADVFWYRKKARRASSASSWTTAMALLTRAPAINNRTCGHMSVSDGWPRQRGQERRWTNPGDAEHQVIPPELSKVLSTPQAGNEEESGSADQDPDGEVNLGRLIFTIVTNHGCDGWAAEPASWYREEERRRPAEGDQRCILTSQGHRPADGPKVWGSPRVAIMTARIVGEGGSARWWHDQRG